MKVGGCSQVDEYMNHNVCQRSKSFSDLGPRSVRLNLTAFPLETAEPMEVIFHVEPARNRSKKI